MTTPSSQPPTDVSPQPPAQPPQRISTRPPLKHWLGMIAAFFVLLFLLTFGAEVLNYAYRSYTKPPASRLVGQPLPDFTMPTLGEPSRMVSRQDLLGTPYLLSTWSSWCYGCKEEHPTVARFAESKRIKVIGFNIQDEPQDAAAWLQRFGNPYAFTLVDGTGRTANRMEIFTSPHHVLVDARGVIRWKRSAVMDERMVRDELLPVIDAMERQP
jgi:cytochrome c biogenesis protein CcmG, thiol:disulfide interchange protein DsbE